MSAPLALSVHADPRSVTTLRGSATYASFTGHHLAGHFLLSDHSLNAVIDQCPLVLWLDGRYRLPERAQAHAQTILKAKEAGGAVIFNEGKVRLAEDLTLARLRSGQPLHVQATDYLAGVCTNDFVGHQIRASGESTPVHAGVDVCAPGGVLSDLADSVASNHIGAATLAVTSDGYLVTTRAASSSAQSAGLLAPAGAGAVELADVQPGQTLRSLVLATMQRELAEECGLDPDTDIVSTTLTGYGRDVGRGGKPEFFGTTRLSVTAEQLQARVVNDAYVETVLTHRYDSGDAIAAFTAAEAHTFSYALHMALLLFHAAEDRSLMRVS